MYSTGCVLSQCSSWIVSSSVSGQAMDCRWFSSYLSRCVVSYAMEICYCHFHFRWAMHVFCRESSLLLLLQEKRSLWMSHVWQNRSYTLNSKHNMILWYYIPLLTCYLLFCGNLRLFLWGINSEAGHSPPSSIEVKNAWWYSLPHVFTAWWLID
jgi:hypothetical protein